jgi:hypothetical protein
MEIQEGLPQKSLEEQAQSYASREIFNPQEAFGKFAASLIPPDATDLEKMGAIQEAARIFNKVAEPQSRINLFCHFTDDAGAEIIKDQHFLGKEGESLYLTTITPDQAKPLFSAEDAKLYELYFRDKKVPETLKERMKVIALGLKFKWQHGVERRIKESLGQVAIPVGGHKLEKVLFLATTQDNPILKRDRYGQIYIERPIKVNSDPEFQTFGPYSTK